MVRVSSPTQSRSKAVVCVSTPRMYPRSGYFLVFAIMRQSYHMKLNSWSPNFCPCMAIRSEISYLTFSYTVDFIRVIQTAFDWTAIVDSVAAQTSWDTQFGLCALELLAVSSVFDLSPNCFESFGTNSFIGYEEPGNFSVTISFACHCEIHTLIKFYKQRSKKETG